MNKTILRSRICGFCYHEVDIHLDIRIDCETIETACRASSHEGGPADCPCSHPREEFELNVMEEIYVKRVPKQRIPEPFQGGKL